MRTDANHAVPEACDEFLDLLEGGDLAAIGQMLHEDVTWTTPLTATGQPEDAGRFVGKDVVLAQLEVIAAMMQLARFVDRRVSVTADGRTTFVQANGDFRTTAGEPYRNVYVFRLDWLHGRIVDWEEYANPVTIRNAFPSLAPDRD